MKNRDYILKCQDRLKINSCVGCAFVGYYVKDGTFNKKFRPSDNSAAFMAEITVIKDALLYFKFRQSLKL